MKYFIKYSYGILSIIALIISTLSYQKNEIQQAIFYLIWMAYFGIKVKLEEFK